ncbi:MAG: hypothetical protein KDA89_09720, partial [Planctomycetaceae bacterium]|nr:hypothetical protein [Planctomycetaceae bacterium]
MRRHGFLAIIAAATCAGTGWLFSHVSDLGASEEQPGSFREAVRARGAEVPEPTDDESGIRLNFFETTWDRVLQNVAEQGKLVLVMDRVPHGRYARRDRKRYDTETVISILNSELEPQGFRLVRQGNFLVVLNLDQARTRYARPVLTDRRFNSADRHESRDSADEDSHWQAMETGSRSPAAAPFSAVSARKDDGERRVAWASQQSDDDPQSVRHTEQSPFSDPVIPRPKSAGPEDVAAVSGPLTTRTVRMKHGKAAEVARSIYLVFEHRAELVREGLEGLPTFVVYASERTPAVVEFADEDDTPMFRVGINQAENVLVVEAVKTRADHLVRLIADLDQPTDPQDSVKLLPNNGIQDATARDLNDRIHRLVALQEKTGRSDQSTNGAAAGNRPADDAQGSSDESSLNLRGEVNVQAMQELGIIILKGNEADVQKVEAIIKQLEELSVGSLPDIHLLTLMHINSESMAELLTSVYEQLSELRQRDNESRKSAAFIPVVQPNALLIISSALEREAILKLAEELDRPIDPSSELKVFSLKNAVASQVVEGVEAFYQERGGLGTRVRVMADVRTNAIVVQGRPNDLEEVGRLIEGLDRDQPGAVHRMEVIQLNHATAEELATVINTAIQSVSSPPQQQTGGGGGFGQNQGPQELRDGKSVALEFLSASDAGQEMLRSGILVDVRVNADPRTNTLLITAPESSMPLLKALVRELDRSPS